MKEISNLKFPEDVLYSKAHTWAKEVNGLILIGITDFAQKELGDINMATLGYSEIVGKEVKQVQFNGNEPCTPGISDVSIESAKTVSDIYAPVSGQIAEVNKALEDAPEKINKDAFGAGWLFKIKPSNFAAEKGSLLNAGAYKDFVSKL